MDSCIGILNLTSWNTLLPLICNNMSLNILVYFKENVPKTQCQKWNITLQHCPWKSRGECFDPLTSKNICRNWQVIAKKFWFGSRCGFGRLASINNVFDRLLLIHVPPARLSTQKWREGTGLERTWGWTKVVSRSPRLCLISVSEGASSGQRDSRHLSRHESGLSHRVTFNRSAVGGLDFWGLKHGFLFYF